MLRLLLLAPKGAPTSQPRATPWGLLKGHNKRIDHSLVSPFQGWLDAHLRRIPRADPARGVPPAWAFLFRPLRGSRKARHQKEKPRGDSLSIRTWPERVVHE